MSIKHGLLALLEPGPKYGYQLKAEFESATGAAWPLNIGQVYTTLQRLERDGQVEADGDPDPDGRVVYAIAPAGRAELASWFSEPVLREGRPRDELAIKLAMALTTPGVDVRAVVQRQRTATLSSLQSLTRAKASLDESVDVARLIVLDSLIFSAEAEVSWLDRCEARMLRHTTKKEVAR